ncbi:hypothetical protein F4779DRAFT_622964 [Xylariaceae sp. FL0662B]|nr:hypothetical protein F4779DRAFT_622964 [Xylariaceae sp. FL0662B]
MVLLSLGAERPQSIESYGNVRNYEVVLANESVIDPNVDKNPNLRQALKGGPGNFSLVTRFDMYFIPYPDPSIQVWGGFSRTILASLMSSFVDFTKNVRKRYTQLNDYLLGLHPG